MNANAYLNRGCCYEKQKKTDLAYKDYETSLVIDKILENMDGSGGTIDKININNINETHSEKNQSIKNNIKEKSSYIVDIEKMNNNNSNNNDTNQNFKFQLKEKEKVKTMKNSVNTTLTHLTNLTKKK